MKILLVSISNKGGGAARAVDSLAKALVSRGVLVEVLTYDGTPSADYPIRRLNGNCFQRWMFLLKNKIARWMMKPFDNPSHDYRSINIFPSSLLHAINHSDADLVHFHWIGGEMMSIRQMGRITKPVVWTLHDGWMLHGCYHIEPHWYEPYQTTPPSNRLDSWVLRRKKKALAEVNYHFTTPSRWLTEDFEHSYLNNGRCTCQTIRNIIDTTVWRAIDKDTAKRHLKFDPSKKHILFIASNLTTSFNKGYVHVKKVLEKCDGKPYIFHFIGTDTPVAHPNVIVHGRVSDAAQLAWFYSACDMTLQPSFCENLSYVSVESMLCGTPVLCFATTGLDEIVVQGVNGYKARKFDTDDLYHGLEFLANGHFDIPIEQTIPDYLPGLNIERYLALYRQCLDI